MSTSTPSRRPSPGLSHRSPSTPVLPSPITRCRRRMNSAISPSRSHSPAPRPAWA
jgi:hypothetical protein